MRTMLLVAISTAFVGCASRAPPPLVVSGETVLIQGSITDATAAQFKQILNQGRVSRVLLASGGGLVEPSLSIATEIHQRRLDVEVVGNCFSSCANYIFPAGATKVISGLGVVAWHGNMSHMLHLHASGARPLDPKVLTEVRRLQMLEDVFFESIGLDQFICWFGKLEPYNARNMYFLSGYDMARFGLTGVNVRAGYESTDVSPYNVGGIVDLQFVKVDWENIRRPAAAP